MDTYNPYDLVSALDSAAKAAQATNTVRYVVQTPVGYHIHKDMKQALYLAWEILPCGKVNAISLV